MAADAGVSLAVVLGGVAIALTGSIWVDPALSLVVVARGAGLDLVARARVVESRRRRRAALDRSRQRPQLPASRPGVAGVHDLHIWGLSTTQCALTAHLVVPDGDAGDDFLHRITRDLERSFGIGHATIQIERGDAEHPCGALEDCR